MLTKKHNFVLMVINRSYNNALSGGNAVNDRQIQAFLAICEMGSMNRAAEKIYISQPALKRRVDLLEEELGTMLFMRTSGGCVLTEAGKVFRDGLLEFAQLQREIVERTRRAGARKTLRMCTMIGVSMEKLDSLLLAFMHENPDVQMEWVQLPTSEWIAAVADGRADACSCLYVEGETAQFDDEAIAFMPNRSMSVKMYCVASVRHPLAGREQIAMEELHGYAVCCGPQLYHCGGMKEYAQRMGMNIQPDDHADKRYHVIDRCEKGAIYIHAGEYADNFRPLTVMPLLGFECMSCWVWRKEKQAIVQRFLRFCGSV